MRRAVLVCALTLACTREDEEAPRVPAPTAVPVTAPMPVAAVRDDAATLADDARAVMAARCGLCHLPEASEQPRALGVFDLSRDDWSAGLTDEQLVDIEHRLVEDGASFDEVDAVRTWLGASRPRC